MIQKQLIKLFDNVARFASTQKRGNGLRIKVVHVIISFRRKYAFQAAISTSADAVVDMQFDNKI